jgi:hypothetical protein
MKLFICAAVFSILLVPIISNASIIYDQPLDPIGYGYTANYDDQNILEDFIIPSRLEVNRVTWHGLFSSGTSATNQSVADFDIIFFKTDPSIILIEPYSGTTISGLPEQTPFYAYHATGVTGTGTGVTDMLHGGDIYQWTVDMPPVQFSSPGKYWIDIRASFNENDYFLWEHSASVVDSIAVHPYAAEFPFVPYFPYYVGEELIYEDAADFWSWNVSLEYYNTAQAFRLEYSAEQIAIDIKPNEIDNAINLKKSDRVAVALLSTADFYAPAEVDQSTLSFGNFGGEDSLLDCSTRKTKDVDGDGLKDLICHFSTVRAEFQCGNTEGILRGKKIDGTPIEGKDLIKIIPCKKHNY